MRMNGSGQLLWGNITGSFLAENDIKYLLIRRDMPFSREILSVPWVDVVLQNTDYCLLRVIQAHGKRATRSWSGLLSAAAQVVPR